MMQVPAQVTVVQALAVRDQVLTACAGGELEFDLASLREYDSSLLTVLLAIRRAHGGARVRFLNVPANLRKLATLYGVDALLFEAPAPDQP